ncbi:MAG TPA: GDP-L-fucose synthase [Bacteroidales bacterium]|mgnify:CR=1 FL=1|nr:GDP-L-fucose synthase [Bacteroidales bacterium]HQK68413.1 GDP-L-fucose synthase [Bacteroidales bacterium]
MDLNSRIYIAGHTGLVGSAIRKTLESKGYNNLIFRSMEELDLTDQKAVNDFFHKEKPEYVFLAAALVGGIVANNTYRADFIYQNIMIQSNVIFACWKYKVKKLLFLGSTCIYPKNAPQPLKEEYLLTSSLEYTNEPYAIAKIAGLKMCEAFNTQYKTNFIAVMPTNLYGPGDNFNLEKSHVLPALLRKIILGKYLEEENWDAILNDLRKYPVNNTGNNYKKEQIPELLEKYGIKKVRSDYRNRKLHIPDEMKFEDIVNVAVWGTGKPLREFMYSPDMAAACVFVMENVNVEDIINLSHHKKRHDNHPPHFINIGTQEEISIKELAHKIRKIVDFKGDLVFDHSKPDGTMRKTTDITLLEQLGFKHRFNLDDGLQDMYDNYLKKPEH